MQRPMADTPHRGAAAALKGVKFAGAHLADTASVEYRAVKCQKHSAKIASAGGADGVG